MPRRRTFRDGGGDAVPSPSHIVIALSDDQGWADIGYRDNRFARTPHLVAMASNGLRFERFYATPICSPTRASILTGRAADRTGVHDQGVPLRLQERSTIAALLKAAGWATAHLGKWHLDGFRAPGMGGVPILAKHPHGPGNFGFEHFMSSTGVFEVDAVLSRNGVFEDVVGDSSDVLAAEALRFIGIQAHAGRKSFTALWYPSPHEPWVPLPQDRCASPAGTRRSKYYGELHGLDRSIGSLRRGLRELGVQNRTLLIFSSDNGGYSHMTVPSNGGLRGFKRSLWEGGIRVPAIAEWPGVVAPSVSWVPACVYDLLPTILQLAGLPLSKALSPQDGVSLVPRLIGSRRDSRRSKSIGIAFTSHFQPHYVLIDNDLKIIWPNPLYSGLRKDGARDLPVFFNLSHGEDANQAYEGFNISDPRKWSGNASEPARPRVPLAPALVQRLHRLWRRMQKFVDSVAESRSGRDYPEKRLLSAPTAELWHTSEAYRRHLPQLLSRPQHRLEWKWLERRNISWWPAVRQLVDSQSLTVNVTRQPRSRFEALGGYTEGRYNDVTWVPNRPLPRHPTQKRCLATCAHAYEGYLGKDDPDTRLETIIVVSRARRGSYRRSS